jgi:hypothetical protein
MKRKFTLIILILITWNMYLQAMDDNLYVPTHELEEERLSRIISIWPNQTAYRISLATNENIPIASMLLLIPNDPFICPILGEISMPPKNYPNALEKTELLIESSLKFLRSKNFSYICMHKNIYEKIKDIIINYPYVKKDDLFRLHLYNHKLNY